MKRALMTMAVSVGLLMLLSILTPAGANLWSLLSARGWVLPDESSVWRFRVTVDNMGSGEWWLYGEDDQHYYHFTGEGQPPYRLLDRAAAARCAGFSATDALTWCAKAIR